MTQADDDRGDLDPSAGGSGGRHAAEERPARSQVTVTFPPADGAPLSPAGATPPPGSVVSIAAPLAEPGHRSDRAATQVTCPECGTVSAIDSSQRDASDFCPTCDFPLFWAPGAIPARELAASGDGALRRLPGTVGRATLASLVCPACSEPNSPMALLCVRCGASLIPDEPPPPPPPPPVVAPLPPLVEEPRRINWWLIIILAVLVAAIITLAILYGLDVIF